MTFLIGTDEAGYGPNYGPLVVSATVWEIDDGLDGRGAVQTFAARDYGECCPGEQEQSRVGRFESDL